MTPEERKLLEETHQAVVENNKILQDIRRSGRISLYMRILYWAFIIALSLGALYFIQPYVNNLKDAYTNIGNF